MQDAVQCFIRRYFIRCKGVGIVRRTRKILRLWWLKVIQRLSGPDRDQQNGGSCKAIDSFCSIVLIMWRGELCSYNNTSTLPSSTLQKCSTKKPSDETVSIKFEVRSGSVISAKKVFLVFLHPLTGINPLAVKPCIHVPTPTCS